MNILKPAELKQPELKRLTESLERHGVTKLEITKSGIISKLMMTPEGWRVTQA